MGAHISLALPPRRRPEPTTLREAVRRGVTGWLLAATCASAAAAAVQLASGGTLVGDVLSADQGPAATAQLAYEERFARLSERLGCSRSGLADGVIPGSALINLDGSLRAVTFDRGWASYEGRARGSLAAVCRETLPNRPAT